MNQLLFLAYFPPAYFASNTTGAYPAGDVKKMLGALGGFNLGRQSGSTELCIWNFW